ncbi:MAG TPA: hypothetical protein VHX13_09070 [Acidobacteriaceae bacterium]|jgi:hypothetical protein|nr:hypothetical protein [Acidobacteriaceae bacterium]
MNNPIPASVPAAPSIPADVLQSDHHAHFTIAEIAKAVARHKREHPNPVIAGQPQKTRPRH